MAPRPRLGGLPAGLGGAPRMPSRYQNPARAAVLVPPGGVPRHGGEGGALAKCGYGVQPSPIHPLVALRDGAPMA
jgi:hypothetical protein